MPTASTSLLGLALPVTGELSGTWGQTVNDSITSLLDSAVAGTTTLSADVDVTLTTTTLAANQARQAILLCTGARTAQRTITAPAQSKTYVVSNATTGGFAVKLVGAGPTTGVTIAAGETAQVVWTGSDFVKPAPAGGPASFSSLQVGGQYVSPYTMRNRIINGNMAIDQRNSGGVVVMAGGVVFGPDRWRSFGFGSMQVVANTDFGFPNALQYTTGVSNQLTQRIESANIADIAQVSGSVTLTFYAKAASAITVTQIAKYATAKDDFTSTTSLIATALALTTTLTKYTWTFALNASCANGLEVGFAFPNGSVVCTFTGVQLEAGSVSTPFEYRPYGLELALCQRYYETGSFNYFMYQTINNGFTTLQSFAVKKRAVPTMNATPTVVFNVTSPSLAPYLNGFVNNGLAAATGAVHYAGDFTASAEM